MRRRNFMVLAGAGLVAGCSGEGGTETMEGGEGTEAGGGSGGESTDAATTQAESGTMTPTAEPTATAASTSSGSVDIGIGEAELRKESGSYSTDVGGLVQVVNSGSARVGQIELSAKFYDGEDSLMESANGYLPTLGGGQTWDAYVPYLGSSAEDVESVKIEGEYAERVPDFNPDSLPVSEVSTESDDMQVTTTGKVANETGGELSYLEAVTLHKSEEDTVLTSALDNVNDVSDGETWSFETTAMPPAFRLEEISDASVYVSMSSY